MRKKWQEEEIFYFLGKKAIIRGEKYV